jgi:predicted nucleotidyltransferase
MNMLSDSFLQKLVSQLDNENTMGVTLAGSFARRQGGPYSDVDLMQYVREIPANETENLRLCIIDGYLVSVKLTTLQKEYAGLQNPGQAIWVIPGLRQACILLDKDGSIATLKETAVKSTWEPLQVAANDYISWILSTSSEEIQKILSGLICQNESKTIYAVWSLTRLLADAMLIQSGTFVPSENEYIDRLQETVGRTSSWTHLYRLAIGLDQPPFTNPAFVGYGIACLGLYRNTVAILHHLLLPEDVTLVDRTLEIITEAGY